MRKSLRDPDNLDFRLVEGSLYLDKGIGPYGKESVSPKGCNHDDSSVGGVYWISGHQQLLANMPIPPNGTTTAKCDADLMWLSGYGAQSHFFYSGTNKTAIAAADSASPELVCELKSPANIVSLPKKLKLDTTYYNTGGLTAAWKIKDKCGSLCVS